MDFAPDWRVIPEEKVVLHKKIGEGVSAKVWLAEDKDTHELYAIKYFKASRTCYRQFCKEVKNLVLLNGHDPERMYVPKFHGIMKSRSKLCIVMELIQGRTVAHELAFSSHENVGLPMHLIRSTLRSVLETFQFMSSESIGMVHCDVKPENIVIVNEKAKERAVLIDFGLASKQHKMQENMYIQSRWYRSPEVLLGIQATIQADMWSLGCVLVEMFCGICPFRGKDSLDQMLLVVDAFGMPPEHMHERCDQATIQSMKDVDSLSKRPNRKCREEEVSKRITSRLLQHRGKWLDETNEERRQVVDLVLKMLVCDPEVRITPGEALRHPFVLGKSRLVLL